MANWNELVKKVEDKGTLVNFFCEGHKTVDTLPISKPILIDRKFDSVLDFGCGIGRNFPYFKAISKKLYAYDLPAVLERCVELQGKEYLKGVEVVPDITDFDKKVDIVFALFCFQHFCDVAELKGALENLARISDNLYVIGRPYMDDINRTNVFEVLKSSPFKYTIESSDSGLEKKEGEGTYEILLSQKKSSEITTDNDVIFKSYADAVVDIKNWCKEITFPITHVCGLPRSGCFIAGVIGHHLNIPIVPIENVIKGNADYFRLETSRPINASSEKPSILVVDDTSWSGHTIRETRELLKNHSHLNIKYGALYCSQTQSNLLDTNYQIFSSFFHTFEWNFARDVISKHCLFDMDGVLCEDCEDDSVESKYLKFIREVKPLYLPKYKVKKIVTARMEKYREETEEWLSRHGVEYEELCMMPSETHQEREQIGFGRWKALKYIEDKSAKLFIESDILQAVEINQITGRPVLCVDDMRLLV